MGRVFKRRGRSRGQSLVEFALVFPVLIAILGGIIQFGMIFWAQNTLTQVVRDTGRWAATQQACSSSAVGLAAQVNVIASNASLIGYSGAWTVQDLTASGFSEAGDTAVDGFTGPQDVGVAWVQDHDPATGGTWTHEGCPPKDNQAVYHVTIKIADTVPVFFPGMQYLPGFAGNKVVLSSTAQFRMEPSP